MKEFLNMRMLLAGNLLLIACVLVLSVWAVYHAQQNLRNALTENIDTDLSTIAELATLTDRNGADNVVSSIIKDCPNRAKFDSLLNNLATLDQQKLLTAQQLFNSCGGFYAERKAVMVSKLQNDYSVLKKDVDLLSVLDGKNPYGETVSQWKSLADMESERSELLNEQVTTQQKIISVLVTGVPVNSKSVSDLSDKAKDIARKLIDVNERIDTLRTKLTS